MRLRETLVPIVAAGLAVTAPACSFEKPVTEQGVVRGFDRTKDVEFQEKRWHHVEGADSAPYSNQNEVRNVMPRIVKNCVLMPDEYGFEDTLGRYYGQPDDIECSDDLWYSTGEDDENHYANKPKTVWDFDSHEWETLGECKTDVQSHEMKAKKPRSDEDCVEVWRKTKPKDDRREQHKELFHIKLSIKNEDGTTRYLTITSGDPQIWSKAELGDCAEVKGYKSKPNQREIVGTC